MRRTILLLATVALTLLVASGVALAATIGSAQATNKVVGPGESIQKAINAADPGDTIVVRGVHREDVFIRKDGIKLRGEDDAVIEAPPKSKADSPCSKFAGTPEGICVLGEVDFQTGQVRGYVENVRISGFTIRGFKNAPSIELTGTRDATAKKNRVFSGGPIVTGFSVGTKYLSNVVRGTDEDGIGISTKARDVTVEGNDVQGSAANAVTLEDGATDVTVEGNDFTDNNLGVLVVDSPGNKILSNDIKDSTSVGTVILDSTGTKIVSNDISRSGDAGISIFGPERANNDAKVVGNNISGGPVGIYVADAHRGFFAGNTIHDNCAGMFFEADGVKEPVSGFEVKANTVENNTRLCRGGFEGKRNVSGIGIALLGTTDMEVTGNHLSGNVPSGPTSISGGVVVSTDPGFGGSAKLRNNSVIGNHFGRNKPDIFWDKSGSGNRFLGNLCNTSVPSSLCD
jgi:parallel beta-helix repeat protein